MENIREERAQHRWALKTIGDVSHATTGATGLIDFRKNSANSSPDMKTIFDFGLFLSQFTRRICFPTPPPPSAYNGVRWTLESDTI